jgi:hypothetical protein
VDPEQKECQQQKRYFARQQTGLLACHGEKWPHRAQQQHWHSRMLWLLLLLLLVLVLWLWLLAHQLCSWGDRRLERSNSGCFRRKEGELPLAPHAPLRALASRMSGGAPQEGPAENTCQRRAQLQVSRP